MISTLNLLSFRLYLYNHVSDISVFDILAPVSYVPVNKNGHDFITGRHITLIQSFFKYGICSEIVLVIQMEFMP